MKKRLLVALLVVSALLISGCGKTKPSCKDGGVKKDGVCQVVLTEIEQKLYDTAELNNFTLEVSILVNEEEASILMAFEDGVSMYQTTNETEYFTVENNESYRIYLAENGYKKEKLASSTNPVTLYQFFKGLKESDLALADDMYMLNYDSYTLLDEFKQSFDRNATVQNVVVKFGESYISEFNFDIKLNDITYHLMMNFTKINETEIEVPSHV